MPTQRLSTAWLLAAVWTLLIVYASLYPFADWRDQGLAYTEFLWAPLPRRFSSFDVWANLAGYLPLGLLLAVAMLRSGPQRRGAGALLALVLATLASGLLSFAMEAAQTHLPRRVPSNIDLATNTLGAAAGALLAVLAHGLGVLDWWGRLRQRWIADDAQGAVVLLALWPPALLFPSGVPLGLGQVYERVENALAEVLMDTPFLEWLPVREVELQPLLPLAELLCVATGLLVPVLLAYGLSRSAWHRVVFAVGLVAAGVGASALSSALSYGPQHAWAWLTPAVKAGLALGMLGAVLLLPTSGRAAAALGLLMLGAQLALLNQAPTGPYLAQVLQAWEQGRFIRFHGLAQWLGWVWPYAALLVLLARVLRTPGRFVESGHV